MQLRPTAAAVVAALALVPVVAEARTAVKPPKPGTYSGHPGNLTMSLSGAAIDLVAFDFRCGTASGRTSLNSIKLKKTRRGYAFAIKAHGIVSYSDNQDDENAAIDISGRFSRTGKSAAGAWRVTTPRCGHGKTVKWRAAR